MKQKLLIPLDGSEFSRQIVPYVRRIADPDTTEIVLLRVAVSVAGLTAGPPRSWMAEGWALPMYESARDIEYAKHPIYASQQLESVLGELEDSLRPVVEELTQAGYQVSVAVRFGEAAPEIVEFTTTEGIDLIAMATHGRTGISRLVLGSVAEYVLRRANVPVVLVRPFTPASEIETSGQTLAKHLGTDDVIQITAATDGSTFAQIAVAFAGDLTRALDNARLTLVVAFNEEQAAAYGRDILDDTWDVLGEVEPRPKSVPLVGYTEDEVLQYLAENPTDLLIVGPFGDRGTTEPTAIGRTTQRLVYSAPASMLVVKGRQPKFRRMLACASIDDETTVNVAVALAHAVDADLGVLHVIPPEAAPYLTASDEKDIPLGTVLQQDTSLSRYIKAVLSTLEAHGFERDAVTVRRGTVPAAIFEEAEIGAYDMIIIGSHCTPPHFPGSVANHIVKYADRPVLVVRMTE